MTLPVWQIFTVLSCVGFLFFVGLASYTIDLRYLIGVGVFAFFFSAGLYQIDQEFILTDESNS